MSDTIDSTPTLDEAPPRRLVRTNDGRWLGGVAAGLGRYFDVNPLVYRIAFAALAFAGGTGLLLYLAAWLVIPSEDRDESVAVEALREHRERPWLLLGVGLLGLGAMLALSEARFWPGNGNVWLAATLVGVALVWWHVSNRDSRTTVAATGGAPDAGPDAAPASPPRAVPAARRQSLLAPVLGVLLAAAGFFGLLAVLDVYDLEASIALAAGVVLVGAAIAAGAVTGRRVGGLVLLGLVLLAGFGVAASSPVTFSSGVGDKVERPLGTTALKRSYELGVGNFTVDLTSADLPAGTTKVDATLGVGDLVVTVPADVALEIDASAGVGEIDVLGRTDDGAGAHESVSIPGPTPDAPVLELDANVAIGHLEIVRG